MKRFFLIALCLIQFHTGFAQQQYKLNLTVGDVVPDLEISDVINYPTNKIKFSDFKDKLLILDFWATWCSPCISSFPHLDSLQKKFSGKLQILPVTSEDKEKVSKFLKKLSSLKGITLQMSVTNDLKLSAFFQHNTIPHYVWIDTDRKVIAITESGDLNEENLFRYFNYGKFNYRVKEDGFRNPISDINDVKFSTTYAFKTGDSIEVKNLDSSQLTIHSVLTKYVDPIEPITAFGPEDYIFCANTTIYNLYKAALYGNAFRVLNTSSSNLHIDIADSFLYKHITSISLDGTKVEPGLTFVQWLKENGYCYELKVPKSLKSQKFKIMLSELNTYFGAMYGIEGLIEKRINKYLALIRISDKVVFESKGGLAKIESDKISLKAQNSTFKTLINSLILPLQSYPLIEDETRYSGNIDVQLNCNLSDLIAVNKELARYGLQLVEKEKLMDVAVIKMKKN